MKSGIRLDEIILLIIILCCVYFGVFELGKNFYFYMIKNGFYFDIYIGSVFIDMYVKCGRIDRFFIVFFNLREKNFFFWNLIIEGFVLYGYGKLVLIMFYKM